MARLRIDSPDWTIDRSRTRAARSRADDAAEADKGFPAEFLTTGSEVAEEFRARPQAATRARGAAPGPLDVSYELGPGEWAVLAIRHPSGALTFHRPIEAQRRSRGGPSSVRFLVSVPSANRPSTTRGLGARAIKAFLIKVAGKAGDKIAGLVLSKLAAHVEEATWKRKGLKEGWLQVTKETLGADRLRAAQPSSTERSLLLIHGTFSNAASAYRALADSDFFARVRDLYGDRIYAFDHFTLSRTPEQNARMLLDALPDKSFTFDVITHSRGGLVLRNLVERSATFGPLAKRFALGRAVLVASPNEGTPLATPGRWEGTVGWMANLLELFPENPFTTGAEFVANGIVWIARHASGDLPGLHSMDGDGDLIAELQRPPGPPADAYSALVANYNPRDAVLLRMIDTGVDQFFGSANDLVVPSEGGWRIDRAGSSFIPGDRIGCFGPGGNLSSDSVTHVGFFSEKATVDFLVTALRGERQPLAPVDPAKGLPDHRLLRAGAPGLSVPATATGRQTPAAQRRRLGERTRSGAAPAPDAGYPLRLTIVNGDLTFERLPLLIGHYHATKLTGTEHVMNKLIGGEMSEALALGDYPFEPGTHAVFVNRRIADGDVVPRPEAVIVVGLGQEGSLKGAELTLTVCQAVIAWARHVVATSDADGRAHEPLEIAATLIGSGGTGISGGQAAQLIAQGVYEANERLGAASSTTGRKWPRVERLRLVELYLDRAGEAWRALKLLEEPAPERFALDDFIEPGTGPLRRPLDAGYRGAEYDFITVLHRAAPNGQVDIDYALDTRRARTEIRSVSPQGRLVRDLVKTASSAANDEQIGATLFKLLIPVEIESFLKGSCDLQIELDDETAGIPWELLDDGSDRSEPWAIRNKLLRKLQLRDVRWNVRDADGDAYALVIGAPKCPDDYGPLPGAWEEARAVFERLSAPDALGPRVRRLIGDDPADGADARTVVNKLVERDWRIVHVAGHGAPPEAGSTGGVVLSNGCFLGPAEIEAMRVVPELVFINCCYLGAMPNESVLAAYDRARFASSVARDLIRIGVRCVIAAGWAVDDDAAKAFARTFYDRLLAGERFIDAVATARRTAHAVDGNTWAAYQCYGDPDWLLRHDDAGPVSSEPPAHEFDSVTSIDALKLALETLIVQTTYQHYAPSYQLKRVASLEERWKQAKAKWGGSDGVADLFAGVYAAAGNLKAAIDWYGVAIAVSDGDVSLRAFEQRIDLLIRQAWDELRTTQPAAGSARKRARISAGAGRPKPLETARRTIRDGVEMLGRLMDLRPTAERANLCGSAMKRLALVEGAAGRSRAETNAIEEMKRYYELGAELCVKDQLPDLFYPASNCIAAELALHAGQKGWKIGNRSLFGDARKSLAKKNEHDPDFWSIVDQIQLDLYEAVAETALAGAWPSLEKRYENLYARMRARSYWSSVYDTARFVLTRYRERATAADRRAADSVLAKLKNFTASDIRVARHKTRR
jgi:hypothetical protein